MWVSGYRALSKMHIWNPAMDMQDPTGFERYMRKGSIRSTLRTSYPFHLPVNFYRHRHIMEDKVHYDNGPHWSVTSLCHTNVDGARPVFGTSIVLDR